jgi:plastocyanin
MLAATAISVPLLLVGAGEAAGSAHGQVVNAAHHVAAARDVRAKRHSRAARHPKGATQHPERTAHHPKRTAHHAKRGASRRLGGAVGSAGIAQRAKRDGPAWRAKRDGPAWRGSTTAPALAAKTTAWRPAEARHAARTARSRLWRLALAGPRKAHAAGDPADAISDFKFTPGTLTVHVGDTVTWTNDGPTNHTATADDGSFNTGTLKKGQSASHTFTKAGTFAYICAIHPFMKGKVVVEASASTTAPSNTTSSSTTSSSTTSSSTTPSNGSSAAASTSTPSTSTPGAAAATSGATLPATGFDVGAGVLCGMALIGLGLGLRRRSS